ncbi:hypothetical protein Desgi_0428 [Desulfoscipio gibsoniae DSM 7213]|uniref:Uncharacterized protein n=1 Tax=Desulfoscipio gibsoniae DSM 7213 TaxID=767817 RepID=R4KHN4_9FIRM|nr:hypothetical protein Desgi_0428 [Desulfoscipio gibsoniae DSM 7213]
MLDDVLLPSGSRVYDILMSTKMLGNLKTRSPSIVENVRIFFPVVMTFLQSSDNIFAPVYAQYQSQYHQLDNQLRTAVANQRQAESGQGSQPQCH